MKRRLLLIAFTLMLLIAFAFYVGVREKRAETVRGGAVLIKGK